MDCTACGRSNVSLGHTCPGYVEDPLGGETLRLPGLLDLWVAQSLQAGRLRALEEHAARESLERAQERRVWMVTAVIWTAMGTALLCLVTALLVTG